MDPMHLTLFFTRGVSLETWMRNGSMNREVALYVRLCQKGVKVSFVTYGGRKDLEFAKNIPEIEVACNYWKLPSRLYELLIPLLHWRIFRSTDVIKTNQTNGSGVALKVARMWRKPLVARSGFMWSEFAERAALSRELRLARKIEKKAFHDSRKIVVTTHAMKDAILNSYNVDSQKIAVIPNYVLTEIFSPQPVPEVEDRICFVGRLVEQKNLDTLLQACEGIPVEIHLVGEGHLRESLQESALKKKVRLVFHGNLPHNQLPALICSSAVFVLPSLYEGHPKALLEAMSCGVAVLGTDVPGIREQILHGETGWLCKSDAQSLRVGIQYLLSHPDLRRRIGGNARNFIENNCSLNRVAEMEFSVLETIKNRRK